MTKQEATEKLEAAVKAAKNEKSLNRLHKECGEGYELSSKEIDLASVIREIKAAGFYVARLTVVDNNDWQAIRARINGSKPKNVKELAAAAAKEGFDLYDIERLKQLFNK